MRFRLLHAFVIVAAAATAPFDLAAQPDALRARYVKREVMLPMRDGVRLFTAIYTPVDTSKTWPIMLQRTPYGVAPYGPDQYPSTLGPSDLFQKEGFIFVYQDVRGRYMSEGVWEEMRPHIATKRGPRDIDESTDTWDTVDWLLKELPNDNARVGMWGISYPGFYAAAAIPGAHPALVAVSPQAPIADLYMGDDAYHNGAFMLAANFGFYASFRPRTGGPAPRGEGRRFDYGTADGYTYFLELGSLANARTRFDGDNPYWNAMIEHPTYDAFWKARAIAPHLRGVTPAVLSVGGWFDAEDLAGPLTVYRAIERHNPGAANALVMGPWPHGGWARGDADRLGNLDWQGKTGRWYREQVEFPFFAHHLKGAPLTLAEATMFETGRNVWRRHETWPPREAVAQRFYLSAGGAIAATPPAEQGAAFDEYPSDPNRPVPYVNTLATGMRRDYMADDQRFAATRPDVLVYESAPLASDLTIAGPIGVTLHVATTGTDADWVVKVIDEYPNDYQAAAASTPASGGPGGSGASGPVRMGGYQQLVRGEPFRGRYRRSFETPEAFTPGRPEAVSFTMPDVYHTFRKGHRLMVHVQSSWFPLVDRNPQTFVDIANARPADFVRQTHRVYRDRQRSSFIEVAVMPE
jgi:putative CocE/NonD family hydrolase